MTGNNKLTTPPEYVEVTERDGEYQLEVTYDFGGQTVLIPIPSHGMAGAAMDELQSAGRMVPQEFAEDLSNHVEMEANDD